MPKVKIVPEYKTIISRFNKVMVDTCHEHLRIVERGSEFTDDYKNKGFITIGDLVKEVEAQYRTYFEDGHVNCDLQYGNEYDRKSYISEIGKWRRLFNRLQQYKRSEKVAVFVK